MIKFRNRLREDLERVARGERPSGVFRDPAANTLLRWPDNRREVLEPEKPKEVVLQQLTNFSSPLRNKGDYFAFYAGQPAAAAKAFTDAMGLWPPRGQLARALISPSTRCRRARR